MDEARCEVVCPGMFLLVLMMGGTFQGKSGPGFRSFTNGTPLPPSGIFKGAVYLPRAPGG